MKFDQHFMVDKELVKKITDYLDINDKNSVLEIGGGKGILTEELVKRTKNLTVVEIDTKLYLHLKSNFPDIDVINDNVLHFYKLEYDKIVGNLPYSIIEGLMRILVNSDFKLAVFTVPRDFMKENLLGLLMNFFFDIERLDVILRKAFNPIPKVTSEIIRIKLKKLDKKTCFIKEIYLQGDKKLKNALINSFYNIYDLTKNQAKAKIPELKFLNKKIYTLNFDEWKELINAVAGI